MITLDALNQLPTDAAFAQLVNCSGATTWVTAMLNARPFKDQADLLAKSSAITGTLSEVDHLEAFAAHPEIGDITTLAEKYQQSRSLAEGEQSAVAEATTGVLEALRDYNRRYKAKFGFIFIVFASDKTADEMLALLKQRLQNDRTEEVKQAAIAQEKITEQRLKRLVL